MHTIVLKIKPVPASRPRVSKWGTYYLPTYEQFRKDIAKLLMGKRTLYTGPLKLDVTFHIPVPVSYSKKRKIEVDGTYCWGYADIDNLEKALYDGMNKVVFEDDSQIAEHHVRKKWINGDGYIQVTIQNL